MFILDKVKLYLQMLLAILTSQNSVNSLICIC